ncbi:nascent polypeptide-associated complex subunit alpha, muscle-specific form [Triticum aestivum]|uniref:nascent polypeptide-associated complex subunit alpha, muscle-specific form n=1 Tax=Triticum aestivum TaxID=4565 RepID=UPI001D03491D|nr:nascent polypeptide-associated complex subunit alpha, muscle-specific form-like [Triticum aestivum]XP_044427319.1 nascent polypeptide-associated complex subunit alpha, muscle-specific form-like [Triticum aestivum]XP_044427320.1 nascent polypeptide-associated complex subunit alpha, muscle-specific form-like [Triticum aestivum]
MVAAAAGAKRKRDLSEDEVYLILHKYSPATILTALQEVAQHAERRSIDWRALVAKTATGITSAREYQMLWRYIAYRHDFIENTEDIGAQPLGDESDLECEIEPFPKPSNEAAAEASRFAKILIYGPSREQCSSHRVNSEVPLLNTPNEKIPRVPSDKQLAQSHRLTNGTGPISNSKQASHTGLSPDPFDGNGPHKKTKKPKAWSNKEDADLMDGVHKCGEGNWLNILHRYKFDSTRTYVQLSQRWAVICRRQGTTKPAKAKSVTTEFDIKATQKAFSMALDMPMGKPGGFSTLRLGASQQSAQHPAPVFVAAAPELKCATSSSSFPLPVPAPAQGQIPLPRVQPAPAQAAASKVSNTSNKSQNSSKKQNAQANPTNAPSSIQAAAIAAGGRIAPASIATNLLKAAQSSQAVHITPKAKHIRPRGKGSSKTTSSKASTMAGEPGTQPGSAEHPELPNCSAPTPSPPVLVTQSIEQVNLVSEVAGVNPPEQSASAHLLEPDRALSTTPVSGPCDNMEMDDDSTFCAVTMEDLFPEDVKQPEMVNQPEIVKQPEMIDPKAEESIDPKDADMLEFDRFVAQGCLTTDCLDKSKGVKIAPGAQGAIPSQKKQPKQQPTVVKSVPVSARGAPATVKKTKTLASHGATFPSTVTSSGLVGTGNAGVLSKAIYRKPPGPGTTGKQNRCQEIMAQKLHAMSSNSSTMARNAAPGVGTPARNAAPGVGTPAKNMSPGAGTPVRNAVPATGTLAKNMAPVTGAPARNAAPGTGITPARNLLTGTGTPPARNSLTGTATPPVRTAAPGTGTPPVRNPAPSAGTPPGRNSLTGTRTPASRQYTPVVNGPSKGNPPASQ